MAETRRSPRLLALLAATVLVTACGSPSGEDEPTPAASSPPAATSAPAPSEAPPSSEPTTDPAAEEVLIVISDFAYEVPPSVPAGAEVTVTNEDDVGHTVTSDDEGVFDVAVGPGETVTFTAPDEPGEYGFFCIPHPHMTETLVVG